MIQSLWKLQDDGLLPVAFVDSWAARKKIDPVASLNKAIALHQMRINHAVVAIVICGLVALTALFTNIVATPESILARIILGTITAISLVASICSAFKSGFPTPDENALWKEVKAFESDYCRLLDLIEKRPEEITHLNMTDLKVRVESALEHECSRTLMWATLQSPYASDADNAEFGRNSRDDNSFAQTHHKWAVGLGLAEKDIGVYFYRAKMRAEARHI
jgi:hypothetical protein